MEVGEEDFHITMAFQVENWIDRGMKKSLFFKVSPIGREAACPSARQMARDEARHGKAFAGRLKRYF